MSLQRLASELYRSSAGDLDAWSSRTVTVFSFFSCGPVLTNFSGCRESCNSATTMVYCLLGYSFASAAADWVFKEQNAPEFLRIMGIIARILE